MGKRQTRIYDEKNFEETPIKVPKRKITKKGLEKM